MSMTNEQIQALKTKAVDRIIAEIKAKHGHYDAYAPVMTWGEFCTIVTERAADKALIAKLQQIGADLEKHLRETEETMIAATDMVSEVENRNTETNDALCKLLPGVQYMDPPDGGCVTPLEQVSRMVADYRQQIAEQAKSIAKLERALDLARNSNSVLVIRSELEARTVTFKLPEPPGPMSIGARQVYCGIMADIVGAFQEACAAAGVTLVVGE
ncbi:hypothetical protein PHDIMM138B_07275 [Phytobacter diazotrophicus]